MRALLRLFYVFYFSSILLSSVVNFLPSGTGWPSAIEARPMRTLDQSLR